MKHKYTLLLLCLLCLSLLTGCLCEHKWNNASYTALDDILEADPLHFAEEYESRYKESCKEYCYETIARNPDKYTGQLGYVHGKVIQVMEGDDSYTLRVAMNGSYSSVILVSYQRKAEESRILKGDFVKMYGMWCGTYTYESTMGTSITLPWYFCEYMDIP